MNLDKAIEILDLNIRQRAPTMPHDVLDALKLGIEALKRVNFHRTSSLASPHILLPGETEE